MRAIPLALFAVLLTGCVAPAPEPTPSEDAPRGFGEPIVAIEACRGATCYEPNIASDPQGRLFVTNGGTSAVGVSTDGGATFVQRDAPPLIGGFDGVQSDVLVQVAPSGRLYWSALVVLTTPVTSVLEGIQVAWSDDGAATWAGNVHVDPATSPGAAVVYPDRQWLGFGENGEMYLTYNQIPSGIWLARSDDAGKTWSGWTRAAPLEGRSGIGQSGPPIVASDGAVLVSACDIQRATTAIFRSTDRGATFTRADVPGGCSWFPMLSTARGDDVALAVDNGDALLVALSHDGGKTFDAPVERASSVTAAPWPILAPDGSLVVAWYEVEGTDATLRIARDAAELSVAKVGGASGRRTPAMTDFASVALLPDGRVAAVWVEGKQALVAVGLTPSA